MDVDLDLAVFFDTDAFAQTAVYTRLGYVGVQIPVIFDSEYSVAQEMGEPGIGDSSPQALCKTAEVENASRGDMLVVGGTIYYVQKVKPDGTGITTLILSRDQ